MMILPTLFLAAALGRLGYMAHLRRRLWEDFAAGEEEPLPGPCGPPEWIRSIHQREEEMAAIGFTRLVYLHNATNTAEGLPNCSAVFVSPDGGLTLSLDFARFPAHPLYCYFPRLFSGITEDRAWGAQSRLDDGTWLFSWPQQFPVHVDASPHHSNCYFPEATTTPRLLAAHREMLKKRARRGARVRAITSAQQYLDQAKEEREAMALYQLRRSERYAGLGVFL